MPDRALLVWLKSGVTDQMEALAKAEADLTVVLQRAVSEPSLDHVRPIQEISNRLTVAAQNALAWLERHPSRNAGVNVGMRQAWGSYVTAGKTIRKMVDGDRPMTPESGEQARAAIELARNENWEFSMAFVKAVGP